MRRVVHTQQVLYVLARICDRGAGHHEGGAAPVRALAQPPQSPQHQCRVTAEDAPGRQGVIKASAPVEAIFCAEQPSVWAHMEALVQADSMSWEPWQPTVRRRYASASNGRSHHGGKLMGRLTHL